ncbi:MAG: NHLP bacteriocin export ABC transporter permease/ATPase subunit [Actinomycetota bacterium]|nr:NHLP bacteriocin export ABC transporter permease/ATPase subunit [Actinomycetota bacterium]
MNPPPDTDGALPWLAPEGSPVPGQDALVTDHRRAWIIEEGKVELFIVEIGALRTARWTPLLTAGPGSLFSGITPADGRALLVRAHVGARLRLVLLDALPEVLPPKLATALEGWLKGTLAAIRSIRDPTADAAHPLTPPHLGRQRGLGMRELQTARVVALDLGDIAHIAAPVAWLLVERGRVRVLGRERNRLLEPRGLAPMGDADWLLVEDAAIVRIATSDEIVAEGRIEPGLTGYGDELRDGVAARIARAKARERLQITERELRDEASEAAAVHEFASILDARVDRLRALDEGPAFAATRIIGGHLGVPIRGPRRAASRAARIDVVSSIAQESRLRTREVTLNGRWWRRDVGPLVGFLGQDEVPVALIPRGRGYVMHDPETRAPRRVGKALAEEIRPSAREFYLPLPEQPATRRDLVHHGLHRARADLGLLLLTALAVAVLGLLVPIMTGAILGRLVPRAERAQITALCMLLLLSASVSTMLNTVFSLAGLRLEGRLDHAFQAGIWDRLMSLPARFFRDFSTGELATAALGISESREVLSGLVFKGILAVVVALADFALISIYDLRLALLTLVLVSLAAAVSTWVGVRLLAHQRQAHEAIKRVNSRTFQIVSGVAKISTAAAEARAYAHWAAAFAVGRRHTYAARSAQNKLTAVNAALTLIAAAAAFWVVIDLTSGIAESTFIGFNVAFFQIMASVLQVSSTAMLALGIVPSLRSVHPILQATPEAISAETDPGVLAGRIDVRHASFSYSASAAPAIDDVSFSVRPGEFLAIVGASGSGKSTLLRLFLAFETPAQGTISYDGQDLAGLDPTAVRRQCGVVLQNATLFSGDILSNIIGSGLYTHEDAWAALEMVGLDAEVGAMPMGMLTTLSDGGGTLSGGQRQRLLLARALVSRPRLLLLDEATSSLDNRSQEVVSESMLRLGATRIVIAHRLSTIRGADQIVVLDRGRLVQSGRYEELIEQEGAFRTLAHRQLA